MLFVTVRFTVRPEFADGWLDLVAGVTPAGQVSQDQAGRLWFDWSRSLDDPHEFLLLAAFRDEAAGAAHLASAHFAEAMRAIRPALTRPPRIVNTEVGAPVSGGPVG